jgi:tetratricopeptide (TPR) repeat protein
LEPSRSFDGYLEAARRDPQFTDAQERMLSLALDFALGGQGPSEAARLACERLLAQDPRAHRAYAALAEIDLAQSMPAAAKEHLEKLLAIEPDWPPAFERLGTALLRMGELEPALARFDQALREKPEDTDALIGRGLALAQLGRHADAVVAWEAAVAHGDASAAVHANLSRALTILGRRAEASTHRKEADRLAGKQPGFSFDRLFYSLGSFVRRLTKSSR